MTGSALAGLFAGADWFGCGCRPLGLLRVQTPSGSVPATFLGLSPRLLPGFFRAPSGLFSPAPRTVVAGERRANHRKNRPGPSSDSLRDSRDRVRRLWSGCGGAGPDCGGVDVPDGRARRLRGLGGAGDDPMAGERGAPANASFDPERSFASLRMTVYFGISSKLIRDPTVTRSFAAIPPAISRTTGAGSSGP